MATNHILCFGMHFVAALSTLCVLSRLGFVQGRTVGGSEAQAAAAGRVGNCSNLTYNESSNFVCMV